MTRRLGTGRLTSMAVANGGDGPSRPLPISSPSRRHLAPIGESRSGSYLAAGGAVPPSAMPGPVLTPRQLTRRRATVSRDACRTAPAPVAHEPVRACPPTPGSRGLGWYRPARRSAALRCALRPVMTRSPHATRTESGAVHRPGRHPSGFSGIRAVARNGFDVRWLRRRGVGGIVSDAQAAFVARALAPWSA